MEIAGRYTLEREVGRGGMGAVWLGIDQLLGRQVALKRLGLAPGVGTPDLERAEREARLAARLNHPHVVAVFDLVVEGTDHWLVMEYVEGRTLAELVREDGALTPDEAAPLLRQAAAALAAAHESGIVHRDVKPSNILVTPEGQVKLSDFGIARAEADASLTQTGLVTGSPAYPAPEVASGQLATAAADVWSLGATAYHAVAGRPPYDVGDNVMGALYRIVHEDPPRLVGAGWLDAMLHNTMTKEPTDRWPMAQVRDFLDGGPLAATVNANPSGSRTSIAVHDDLPPAPAAPAPTSADESGTAVLAPAPVTEPPPAHRRGPGGAVIGVLVALVAVLLFLLFAWLFGAFDPQEESANDPSGPSGSGSSSATSPEGSPSRSSSDPQARTEAMQAFITDYVAAAIEDPRVSWKMLTPEFQDASGGFGQYKKFWDEWSSAVAANIDADADTLTVSYTVTYHGEDEEPTTDDVTLVLEDDGHGSFLIAAER
jgi:eukaryotic-like serine/threonine-protein kinase